MDTFTAETPKQPIAELRHTHDAFMDYMLLNPGATLKQMGAEFGYTVPWLSTVINSDLFQMRLAERRKEVDDLVHADIPARMRGIVAMGLEKIADHMEVTQNQEYIADTTDMLLHRLGYAPKAQQATSPAAPQNQQNNFFVVPQDALQMARDKILANSMAQEIPLKEPLVVEHEPDSAMNDPTE